MGSYVPNTSEEQQEMLRESALTALRRCFPISPEVRVKGGLKLPEGLGENGSHQEDEGNRKTECGV